MFKKKKAESIRTGIINLMQTYLRLGPKPRAATAARRFIAAFEAADAMDIYGLFGGMTFTGDFAADFGAFQQIRQQRRPATAGEAALLGVA